ncbi:MAG: hypothetical protein E7413_03015 [Ruminococcaceae bacterium]|nr:hypothetical protein [Oscillospiraceae bacterium]
MQQYSNNQSKKTQLEKELDSYTQQLLSENDHYKRAELEQKIAVIKDEINNSQGNNFPQQSPNADRMYQENKKYKMFLICTLAVLLLLAIICLLTALRYNQMKNAYTGISNQAGQYQKEIDELNKKQESSEEKEESSTPAPSSTIEPSAEPTTEPDVETTAEPTAKPTAEPTARPTAAPTAAPTPEPTVAPTTAPAQTSQQTSTVKYYVQKIQNGKRIQIGAYNVYDAATNYAYENRYNGYKVYDASGNCIYDPYPAYSESTTTTESNLYYVQKPHEIDPNKIILFGTYSSYDEAKNAANANRGEGYKVYDANGNCMYDPGY